jgi:hypothetical protein
MRIINHTHWRTDHLAAIARTVARAELEPAQAKRVQVTVVYTRGGRGSSGRAHLGGIRCRIRVGRDHVDNVDLAFVLAHEFAHLRGLQHKAMRGSPRYNRTATTRVYYGWAEKFPMARKPVPVAPTLDDRRAERLAHAQAMLARWERRAKAANNKVRTWRGRVRARTAVITMAAAARPVTTPTETATT